MRTIRDVLRLQFREPYSLRKIARCPSLSATTVSRYLEHAKHAGLPWPLPEDLDDHGLESRLYAKAPVRDMSEPIWEEAHRKLSGSSVTLKLVWKDYRATYPDGYSYSRFCALYRA